MHTPPGREAYEIEREELHMELLAKNLFRIVMVGAVAFVSVCAYVLGQ